MYSPFLFLVPFSIAIIISVILIWVILFLTNKYKVFNAKNRTEDRHINKREIGRWGGVAIILTFVATLLLDHNLFLSLPIWGLLFGGVLILFFGLIDDFFELDWKIQLIFQVFLAIFVLFFEIRIDYVTNPFGGILNLSFWNFLPGIILTIFWIILLMNSMNWLDGLDGLSGGVSFIASMTIFFLSLKPEVNQPPMAIVSLVLAGAILGFLFFNFYPARIMAGSSGSMFLGFAIAVMSIFAGAKIATTLLVLIIPVIDSFVVIGRRFLSGKSIFQADTRHLHHELLRLGWSERKIVLFFYLITVTVSFLALTFEGVEKIFLFTLFAMMLLFGTYLLSKKKFLKK